jgi:general secretion pathway protein F
MPAYYFEAANAQGHLQSGLLEADSPRHARQHIQGRGLTVITLKAHTVQTHDSAERSWWAKRQQRLNGQHLALLMRQLASLIQAGLPLDEALLALSEQTDRPAIRHLLTQMRGEILGGHSLSTTFAAYPNTFPPLIHALVAAGEHSGQLGTVLAELADYLEARHTLSTKVMLAFIYPGIVTATALIIVIFLLSYVVPQVVSVFIHTKQTLPLLTRLMMATSNGLREWGWALIIFFGAVSFGIRHALTYPKNQYLWDEWQLHAPLLGPLIRGYNTTRFASTLAILTQAGVPILRALQAATDTLNNVALRTPMDDVMARVREGSSLARALHAHKGFAPVLIHLIRSGESTGKLPAMLKEAARGEAAEVERRTLTLTSFLEPVLILTMGIVVLLIVLAVMLPIIELNQGIR